MKFDCIVVGAGISGLIAASELQKAGWRVVVLEKGRGVGGRMATRRFDGGIFDHGAQFFTVRSEAFSKLVNHWRSHNVVKEWARGFPDGLGSKRIDGHPRYRGDPSMTAIPKFIADGLDVELENAVEGVDVDQQHWHVTTQARKVFTSDHLILSPPLPQSLSLLGKHVSSRIPELVRKTLAGVEYERCIALMATLSGASGLPFPGAIQVGAEPIHWIADNSIKGVSPNSHSITVHAGPKFSEEYWEEDDKIVSDTLWQVSTAWLQPSVSIKSFQIQRWKFSKPRVTLPEPFIAISKPAALLFTGDAFAGPKVEGAALSGLSAAEYLIERGS